LIQEPGARYRQNPRTAAQEFSRTDPLVNRPDTMSGLFQPAISEQTEQFTSLTRTPSDPGFVEEQNVSVQKEQQALQDATTRAVQAAQQRQQQGSMTSQESGRSGTSYTGPNYFSNEPVSQQRQQLLGRTAGYAGTQYQLGGRTAQGIDCSGLVMSVYNSMGFNIKSHSVSGQARAIPGVKTAVNNLKPGDLVVWNDSSHIAIYAGNGQIWDASRSRGTSLRPLWASPNQVYGIAVRLPGD